MMVLTTYKSFSKITVVLWSGLSGSLVFVRSLSYIFSLSDSVG